MRSSRVPVVALIVALAGGACPLALGQADEIDPAALREMMTGRERAQDDAPAVLESVLASLEAEFLTEDERADRRVFHGLWRESDLEDPARRALAALTVGALDDPSLSDPAVPVTRRAEAMLRRGEASGALDLLEGVSGATADRQRAEALENLGRFDEAAAIVDAMAERIDPDATGDAETLTELVRAMRLRAAIRGEPARHYREMIRILARAHQQVDRSYWPAMLVEADLLLEKSAFQDGLTALQDVMRRNPSSAEAWALMGHWSVSTFDFDRAASVADRLERLARRLGDGGAVSPDAAAVRARARLRQDDPDQAAAYLGEALDRYPLLREARALLCAAEAIRYDDERLEACLAEFDRAFPGSPLALHRAGAALSEARQYGPAAEFLGRAIERQPNWPEPLVDLGMMELQAGRDIEALDALRRAVELDPFDRRASNSLTLIEELQTYETIETENFIVRYRPGVDEVMAREMAGPLERLHDVVMGAIDFPLERKTVIELMPDHEWFAVRITGATSIYTIAACTGPVIAMEAPKIGARHTTEYLWDRVVRHEYAHTVTLARTKNRIPHWFTEAAAVHLERAPRDFDRCTLLARSLAAGELFDLEEINVAFVRPEKPSDRSLAYAQAEWMYEYMLERWGPQAPLDLMDGYAEGLRETELVRRVLGIEPEVFLGDFDAWARAQAESWGMLPSPTLGEIRWRFLQDDPAQRDLAADALGRYGRSVGRALVAGGAAPPVEIELPGVTPERLDAWLADHPDHPDLLRLKVERELSLVEGNADEAMIPLLERYARARPVDDLPHRHLARLYLRSDDPSRAVPHLEYLDEREVYSAAYAQELARRYAELSRFDLAMAKADRATIFSPFDAGVRELAARVAIRAGDLDEARRHLEALRDLEPQRDVHERRLEALDRMRGGA